MMKKELRIWDGWNDLLRFRRNMAIVDDSCKVVPITTRALVRCNERVYSDTGYERRIRFEMPVRFLVTFDSDPYYEFASGESIHTRRKHNK